MTTGCFIIARAVHFGACLLFFGGFAFDRFVAGPVFARGDCAAVTAGLGPGRRFGLVLLPIMLLSGVAWFAFVAVTMSGSPWREALQPEILGTVWNQTQFGSVWKRRAVLWLMAAAVATLSVFIPSKRLLQKNLAWVQLLVGGLLLGSLAWAGHGREDSRWHLFADVLHLLVAGLWPTGLLPLALLLRRLRAAADPVRWSFTAALVRRFSALSLGSVVALVLTGWVNAWYLVGSVANLFEAPYGRWLLIKLVLFGCAVAIGAVNLLRLKPRLLGEKPSAEMIEAISAHLRCNVELELFLGTAIVIAVAVLGVLPPAFH